MSIEKGSFVFVDYTAEIKETGETFDTTSEEEAKERGIYQEDATYKPMLVVVGEGWVLRSLDEALPGIEVERPATIEIPPERGFGLRDPSKIRMLPMSRFRSQRGRINPGTQVEVDGKTAVVRTVGAGRVQVDFNPPLAGKTLVYTLTVRKILKSKTEKIRALIQRRIPSVSIDLFQLRTAGARLRVELPEEAFSVEGLQFAKRGITNDVLKFFPEVEAITFLETFQRKPTQPPAEAPPEPEPVQEDNQPLHRP